MSGQPSSSAPATLEDVARHAGVSIATASRALRGMENVAPSTAAAVLSAATELAYRPNAQARSLRARANRAVAIVLRSLQPWYDREILSAIHTRLFEAGYDTVAMAAEDPTILPTGVVGGVTDGRVDGAIVVNQDLQPPTMERLRGWNVPVVFVGGREHEGFSSVRIDDKQVAESATTHLIDAGHTRVALVAGRELSTCAGSVVAQRRAGYLAAMNAAGIGDQVIEAAGEFTIAGGRAAAAALLSRARLPSAIYCMSDYLAVGVIQTLRSLGLTVPGDVAVVGTDGDEIAELAGLSTVEQPIDQIGGTAARLLLTEMAEGAPPERHVMPTRLVIRTSSTSADGPSTG
ncbi:LacI family DNA-binding transcriptional regulator [Euzebya tangerina]|uniref:LacI family DNA-binding transcriptional regulator n=1 Tax=Euzebya tangerina TaxID=591198 RepID=UPI000E320330|nr:LacI family DNA-binding transcriptional regulator [Euzebya tangerina]